jgi:hypothetical protein
MTYAELQIRPSDSNSKRKTRLTNEHDKREPVSCVLAVVQSIVSSITGKTG